jgi:hypothetical protein
MASAPASANERHDVVDASLKAPVPDAASAAQSASAVASAAPPVASASPPSAAVSAVAAVPPASSSASSVVMHDIVEVSDDEKHVAEEPLHISAGVKGRMLCFFPSATSAYVGY